MFDAESLIRYGGLLLMFLVVYGQTGLFFCFFLPSGGIMFTAGVLVATGHVDYSIVSVCSLLSLAAVLGNMTGYWFGRQTGPLLYKRKNSKFLRLEHLQAAEDFYNKHGRLAMAAGPFLPIIRTFSPIVAGIIKLNFVRFMSYTAIGSVGWVFSFVLTGYLVGSMPFLSPYLKYIIVVIIIAVTTPVVIRIVKEFKKTVNKNQNSSY